jgi:DNA invertase Pin-like site-specific DNA recombinase
MPATQSSGGMGNGIRAALYARYSSDNQRDASIDDQLRVCRARLDREGWRPVGTFTDHAVSGATTLRSGYQDMLSAIRAGGVDIVVAESLDRFSRDLEHIAAFYKQASFHGVRVHTLAEGDISELHVGLKGVMGAIYLRDLAEKTRRGLEGRVHAGRCVGSVPYGYRALRRLREDGEPDRGLRVIEPAEAEVVRRIFTDYAAGISPLKIVRALNAEGVKGPAGGIWYDASIRGREKRRDGILRNDLYTGRIVWRRRLNFKDPETGARLRRDAAPDLHVSGAAPDLRIIDETLWTRAQDRLRAEAAEPIATAANGKTAFWDQRRPRHLLSGKVICGACGGPFYPTGKDYLGCQAAKHGVCTNRRTLRRIVLENHVVGILSRQLMRPDLLGAFVEAFNAEWQSLDCALRDKAAARQRDRAALDRKIANLVDVISNGSASPAILAKLAFLEAERSAAGQAEAEIHPAKPLVRTGLEHAKECAARIADLTASLSRGDDPMQLDVARRLIDQVIIHPVTEDDPEGIEFIGDLMDLLQAAGLGATPTGCHVEPDPRLALFVSSIKEGPGAEPLALLRSTRALRPRRRGFCRHRRHVAAQAVFAQQQQDGGGDHDG